MSPPRRRRRGAGRLGPRRAAAIRGRPVDLVHDLLGGGGDRPAGVVGGAIGTAGAGGGGAREGGFASRCVAAGGWVREW